MKSSGRPVARIRAEKYSGNPFLITAQIPWATHYPEHPQVIKVGSTYHMYFHASALPDDYKIGHATASSIYGPWTCDALPAIDRGGEGTWTALYAATPYVMFLDDVYYMWYSGHSGTHLATGFATATDPAGPWTDDPSTPFNTDTMGWVGSVQKVGDTFYMLAGAETGPDLWTAAAPGGPWTYLCRPIEKGPAGTWNTEGNMGESALIYQGGKWRMFFGGLYRESEGHANQRPFDIGYAESDDCVTWRQSMQNPIIRRGVEATDYDYYRMSEITVFYEDDRYYVMYTAMGVDPVLPVLETLAVTTVTLPALVN